MADYSTKVFHWKHDMMFGRGEGNYVCIWKAGGVNDAFELRIPPGEWESIVKFLEQTSLSRQES